MTKTETIFRGKAIYTPSGKAREYSYWACNFYIGCSNRCSYCYLKREPFHYTMGMNSPRLKSSFRNREHALEVFKMELEKNLTELQANGIFFSFSTDPMLNRTYELTFRATAIATSRGVPVRILTKSTMHLEHIDEYNINKTLLAIGMTLTGRDDLEPNASTNEERIKALIEYHSLGYKTFASIEPVIDFESSLAMIE